MSISIDDISKPVREAEYAVRGPVVARAQQLEREGKKIIYCNIGNPQALQQKPLTYLRQILSLCEYPDLMTLCPNVFPADIIQEVKIILAQIKNGVDAYSESKGVQYIREAVATFIHKRDGIASDADSIYLTDGASKGVQTCLRMLIASPQDGIMIPIPQYPLYSATITLYEGKQISYYLDEGNNWRLSRRMLEESIRESKKNGVKPKAICVINPGNPTGAVLDRDNIMMVIDFAREHNLSILADEVYQENIYNKNDKFISFAKVMHEMQETSVPLFSFHSCSKGYLGECGHRGGYFEIRNIPREVSMEITKLQSISLCSNLPGQVAVFCMVKPPKQDSESYPLYEKEKNEIISELKKRAEMVATGLNAISGITCNPVAGAMYAFPRITLPANKNDEDYCMDLLEKTFICLVPGSGFGQIPCTNHFRTTILPPTEQIASFIKLIGEFNATYK